MINLVSKIKQTRLRLVAGALGLVGAISLIATPAFAANVNVPIDALNSPQNGGTLSATLTWSNPSTVTFTGRLYDNSADGSGPYFHFYVNRSNGDSYQQYSKHNTNGANTSVPISGGVVDTGNTVLSVNVWVCNGGNASGTGTTNGGCYGRKYFNQAINGLQGTPSQSLGTHSSSYGG